MLCVFLICVNVVVLVLWFCDLKNCYVWFVIGFVVDCILVFCVWWCSRWFINISVSMVLVIGIVWIFIYGLWWFLVMILIFLLFLLIVLLGIEIFEVGLSVMCILIFWLVEMLFSMLFVWLDVNFLGVSVLWCLLFFWLIILKLLLIFMFFIVLIFIMVWVILVFSLLKIGLFRFIGIFFVIIDIFVLMLLFDFLRFCMYLFSVFSLDLLG